MYVCANAINGWVAYHDYRHLIEIICMLQCDDSEFNLFAFPLKLRIKILSACFYSACQPQLSLQKSGSAGPRMLCTVLVCVCVCCLTIFRVLSGPTEPPHTTSPVTQSPHSPFHKGTSAPCIPVYLPKYHLQKMVHLCKTVHEVLI